MLLYHLDSDCLLCFRFSCFVVLDGRWMGVAVVAVFG